MARSSHIHGDSCIATRSCQFEKKKKKKVELALARKESLILNSSNNLFKSGPISSDFIPISSLM